MYSISFKNKSSDEFGLIAKSIGRRKKAEEKIDLIEIPSRSDELIYHNQLYKPYLREVEFVARDRSKIAAINTWLDGHGKLRTTLDTGGYFLASVITGLSFEKLLSGIDTFRVGFRVNPFFYLDAGDGIITINEPTTLYNPGTFYSEPYIKIVGTGNITLTINDKSCSFTSVDEYIEVDSSLLVAYKGTENQGNKMSGEYPILAVGENDISWSGSVSHLEVIPRWREL